MDTALTKFLFFFAIVIIGVLFEVVVRRFHYYLTKQHYKENHFTLGKYLFLLLFPLIATAIIFYIENELTVFKVFLTFGVVGMFSEWLVGMSYHKVVGQRLWTYHKYAIAEYTSWLSLPLWGLCGITFYLLAQVFV